MARNTDDKRIMRNALATHQGRVATYTTHDDIPGARTMVDQPDFSITARIPTDREQLKGDVPNWSDLVLEISDPSFNGADPAVAVVIMLTRAAGEVIIATTNEALHPSAGGSLRRRLWEDLDFFTDQIMTGEDDSDMIKGKAAGIAWALARLTTPYNPDIEPIRDEAVQRWEESQ